MRRKVIFLLVLAGLVLGFGFTVWPTLFRYDHISVGEGKSYPLRINRFTGRTDLFDGYGWHTMGEQSKTRTERKAFLVEELKKLDGHLSIDDSGFVRAQIYNGTDKMFLEMVVEISVFEMPADMPRLGPGSQFEWDVQDKPPSTSLQSGALYSRRVSLNTTGAGMPLSTAEFIGSSGIHLSGHQTFEWQMISAK